MNGFAIGFLTLLMFFCAECAAGAPQSATEDDVYAFRSAVESGDRAAVRALFNLSADGAAAEDKDILLGGIIRKHPRLFLEELKRSGVGDCRLCLPGLVGNLGDDFVDRFDAQEIELKRRRVALLSVGDKALMRLRDACIGELNDQIRVVRDVSGEVKQESP